MTRNSLSRGPDPRLEAIAARIPVADAMAALLSEHNPFESLETDDAERHEMLLTALAEIRGHVAGAPPPDSARDIPALNPPRAGAIAARLPIADAMAALLSEHNHYRLIETEEVEHREMLEAVLAKIREEHP